MKPELLRALPKMDLLLARPALAGSPLPYALRRQAARQVLDEYRAALRAGALSAVPGLDELEQSVLRRGAELARPALGRVINATGVVLHTNLGRAPLRPRAAAAVGEAARGYSNLEYDLSARRRGRRGAAVEALLCALTGAEAALVVNNNAAAVFLLLSALAAGRGVAISRGELVEIGGGFRVPDILARSGARLVEVGTTNKTRPADYAAALDAGEAQVLLKVHPSNFRVVGFTQAVSLPELGALARERGVPLFCDLGSAAPGSPELAEAVAWADVCCFSGDKLLGGPQAGILLGKAEPLGRLRADPLSRALRPGKLALAALDVAGAPAQTAKLVKPGDSVLILGGAGKGGMMCCYEAMKRVGPTGNVVALVICQEDADLLKSMNLCHHAIVGSATNPTEVLEKSLAVNGGKEYDVSILIVNVPACEMAAILPVRDNGTVYFFSMATDFAKAALGAEGCGKDVTMIVGNGYTKDHAEITLSELRENAQLKEYFEKKYL